MALGAESWLGFKLYEVLVYDFSKEADDFCSDGSCNEQIFGFMVKINWAESLPFLAFLIVNQLYPPHDCFKCFGKDPDRRYSI